MAATSPIITDYSFVKSRADSSSLKSIPPQFTFATDSLPIVDFSLLTSSHLHQRSTALRALAQASQEWGFFILVNHGVPETLLKAIIDASLEYFELPEEEKRRYEGKSASDPIISNGGTRLWRDFLKAFVHPQFHCPQNPQILKDTMHEYSKKMLSVYRKLLYALGENLGLEEGFMDDILKLDECFQLYVANYYPPCPQPHQNIGIPPHTDYGLLIFLIHNGVAGLQIEHNGEWFDTHSPKNSILVNIGDHLEILSNGRYKSVKHRAVVNTEATRVSVVITNGAAPDVVVAPAPQLVEQDGRPFYQAMKFMEYVKNKYRGGIRYLDRIKIQEEDYN